MNPIILPPTMKENSEFSFVKLPLKIDLVSYPARAEGLVNMDKLASLKRRKYLLHLIVLNRFRFVHISYVIMVKF